jgi:hypothetical protein
MRAVLDTVAAQLTKLIAMQCCDHLAKWTSLGLFSPVITLLAVAMRQADGIVCSQFKK